MEQPTEEIEHPLVDPLADAAAIDEFAVEEVQALEDSFDGLTILDSKRLLSGFLGFGGGFLGFESCFRWGFGGWGGTRWAGRWFSQRHAGAIQFVLGAGHYF